MPESASRLAKRWLLTLRLRARHLREREDLLKDLLDEAARSPETRKYLGQLPGSRAQAVTAPSAEQRRELFRGAGVEEAAYQQAKAIEAGLKRRAAPPSALTRIVFGATMCLLGVYVLTGPAGGGFFVSETTGQPVVGAFTGIVVTVLAALAWRRQRLSRIMAPLFCVMPSFAALGLAYRAASPGNGAIVTGFAAALLYTVAVMGPAAVLLRWSDPLRRQYAGTSAELRVCRARTQQARRTWHEGLRAAVFAHLRAAIGPPFYSVELAAAGDAPGLADRTPDAALHVTTGAAEETIGWLRRSPKGGTFALRGPRGAGKSSILRALSAGIYNEPDQRDLAVPVLAPFPHDRLAFLGHLYERTCEAVIEFANSPPYTARTWLRAHSRSEAPTIASWYLYIPPSLGKLADRAQRTLEGLRTMRTETEERTSAVELLARWLKIGSSRKRGRTSKPAPRTEIQTLGEFRDFLRFTHTELAKARRPGPQPRVMVMIDALDEIGTSPSAREFLDSLQSVMDVAGCYFFVAVSGQALSTFAETDPQFGQHLALRFQTIDVEPLTLDEASRMLGARVIGLPQQFVALSYCLAGALPVRLIAVTAVLWHQSAAGPDGPPARLGAAAAKLVLAELTKRARECRDELAAQSRPARRTGTALRVMEECLGFCREHSGPGAAVDVTVLRRELSRLTARLNPPGSPSGNAATPGGLQTAACCARLAAHASFLAVVLDVFGDDLDEKTLTRYAKPIVRRGGKGPCILTKLAQARDYADVNPEASRDLLAEVRGDLRDLSDLRG